jgi:hypothetical protein
MKPELLKFQVTFYDENGKFILSCGEYAYHSSEAEAIARKGIAKDVKNGHFKGITFKTAKVEFFPGTRYGKDIA